jgi:hypothetical protein
LLGDGAFSARLVKSGQSAVESDLSACPATHFHQSFRRWGDEHAGCSASCFGTQHARQRTREGAQVLPLKKSVETP